MAEIIYDLEEGTFAVDGKTFKIEKTPDVGPDEIKIGVRLDDDSSRIAEAHTINEEIEVRFPTSKETAQIINVTHEKNCTGIITFIEMKINPPIGRAAI